MQPIAEARVDLKPGEFAMPRLFVALRGLRWMLIIWIGAGLVALAMSFVPGPGSPSPVTSAVLILMAGGLLGLVWLAAFIQYRRLPAERKQSTWEFFDDHIEMRSTLGTAQLQWRAFVRVVETASMFLFYVQRNICHAVPKRSFAQPSQFAAVRRAARLALGKKAKVRSDESSA